MCDIVRRVLLVLRILLIPLSSQNTKTQSRTRTPRAAGLHTRQTIAPVTAFAFTRPL